MIENIPAIKAFLNSNPSIKQNILITIDENLITNKNNELQSAIVIFLVEVVY